jgi:hypothetical protein
MQKNQPSNPPAQQLALQKKIVKRSLKLPLVTKVKMKKKGGVTPAF